MTTQTFDEVLLAAQRNLRNALLARSNMLTWSRSRDLAAAMLLNLDDVTCCWNVAAHWLREQFLVDRVDGGFHSPAERYYFAAVQAAAFNDVPDMQRIPIDTHEGGVASLWVSGHPIAFDDVCHDPRLSIALRALLRKTRTASKLATCVRYQCNPVGLICLDRLDSTRRWADQDVAQLKSAAVEVVAPILYAARQLATQKQDARGDRAAATGDVGRLTECEARVARLAASGLSYKEIARELGRSHSTIDHHLRSIRQKLGVSSTSRLIRALAEIFPQHSAVRI